MLFDRVCIPNAVWEEVINNKEIDIYQKIKQFFESKVVFIQGFNDLTFTMDYGESEAVILYKELNADFLLIDDKKARTIAENFDIQYIGTLGILSSAKSQNLINALRLLFKKFMENNRYYSIELLNKLLVHHNETLLNR